MSEGAAPVASDAPPWRPLLDGADAARAWTVIDAVAAALADDDDRAMAAAAVATHPSDDAPGVDVTLDMGAAGRALFFAYLDRARGSSTHEARWRRALDFAGDGIGALSHRPGLYSGFTGVAWTVAHLAGLSSDGDAKTAANSDGDANDELDEILTELVGNWRGEYDLVSGLCGFGVYALERGARPGGRALLARVVDKLAASAIASSDGVSWWTRPGWIAPEMRPRYPDGYCNLGLAHGVPAAALVLAASAAAGVDARARSLAEGAARFILLPRLPAESPSLLTACVGDSYPANAAWCYGDPGAAVALVAAAAALGDAPLAERALSLVRLAATRPIASCGVRDAGICHGSAGLALIFHQLHYATGDATAAETARRWYAATVDYYRADTASGFLMANFSVTGEPGWVEDLGLVNGTLGIGLALLAGVAPIAPRWASVLGLALPR